MTRPAFLAHELPLLHAAIDPAAIAVRDGVAHMTYAELAVAIERTSAGLLGLGLKRGDRIALWMEKRFEFVIAAFASMHAGCIFVPINPALKPAQVLHILHDCSVSALVTTSSRTALLEPLAADLHSLIRIAVDDDAWQTLTTSTTHRAHRIIDSDLATIFYTSGSTGRPKGVMVSHRNLVAGAYSVAQYLENAPQDRLLAALPLSFDAGFSQLTTAFASGASVSLLNYLMPRDVLRAIQQHQITGLTAVPPLWTQLAQIDWPAGAADSLRYFATTGGRMPRTTYEALRQKAPAAKPFLMYGLTEAFRATYLPPDEADRRPDSIGRAIPNAEILVLREDGTECDDEEPGELVQRGALVTQGYWNDAEKTAERFRPLPLRPGQTRTEIAVFSGDTVRRDKDGFLYFIGRRDEMIKTSGYRVSPTEIEEACHATGMVKEVAAFGIPHPALGEAIVIAATSSTAETLTLEVLNGALKSFLPAWMLPAHLVTSCELLPRNPNGKIDRKALATQFSANFLEGQT